tara:strand:- start:214 stop:675 length:462 start_codon:yes stop_codon:yes gene_type:complete
MPKVKYTTTKGLVQSAGSTFDMDGNFLTNQTVRTIVMSGAGAERTLVNSDLPCVVILSGSDASTLTLPSSPVTGAVVTAVAGTAIAHVVEGGNTQLLGSIWDNGNATTIARTDVDNKTSVTLANPKSGDQLQFRYTGANWLVWGVLNDTPSLA